MNVSASTFQRKRIPSKRKRHHQELQDGPNKESCWASHRLEQHLQPRRRCDCLSRNIIVVWSVVRECWRFTSFCPNVESPYACGCSDFQKAQIGFMYLILRCGCFENFLTQFCDRLSQTCHPRVSKIFVFFLDCSFSGSKSELWYGSASGGTLLNVDIAQRATPNLSTP